MTPEAETEFIKKMNDTHDSVTKIYTFLAGDPIGDPLANPPRPPTKGLIQEHREYGQRIEAQEKKVESLDNWRTKVKLRFAGLSGAVLVIGFVFNRLWEAITAWFTSKHD